jgi:NAD(P)H-dependent FMN reductase
MTQEQQPRIGIVIGSTREGRFGAKPAHWIHEIAKQRTDLAFELIDLRDHPLPFFNEPRSPAYGPVNNEAARLWAGKLATLDGLIVVTPEYNHGPTASRSASWAMAAWARRVRSSTFAWWPSSCRWRR